MALARDVMRNETLRKRELQRARNAKAEAEEEARQEAIRRSYQPPREAERKALRHHYADKMLGTAHDDKGEALPAFDPEPAEDFQAPVEAVEIMPALEDLQWASPTALAKARNNGLAYADFEGVEPTGAKGYRTADVTALIKAKTDGR